MSAAMIDAQFRAREVIEILEGLCEAMDVRAGLIDLDERSIELRTDARWIDVRINRRWVLRVAARGKKVEDAAAELGIPVSWARKVRN